MFNYVFGMESAILIEDCYFGRLFKESCHMAITQITLVCYLHKEPFISGALLHNIHPQMMVLIAKILKPICVGKHPNFR